MVRTSLLSCPDHTFLEIHLAKGLLRCGNPSTQVCRGRRLGGSGDNDRQSWRLQSFFARKHERLTPFAKDRVTHQQVRFADFVQHSFCSTFVSDHNRVESHHFKGIGKRFRQNPVALGDQCNRCRIHGDHPLAPKRRRSRQRTRFAA